MTAKTSTRRRAPTSAPKASRTVHDGLPFDPAAPGLPRGLARFGAQLDRVRTALAARPSADARGADALRGQVLYKANIRTPLFMLEGLARVACGTGGDEEVFGEILRDVKILEDVTGQVDFWWVVREKSVAWGLPPEFLRHAEDHHQAACGRMAGWLEARAWVDHRYLPTEGDVRLRVHRMGRALADESWPSPRKESRRIAEFFLDRVRSTDAAVRALDLDDVEHGLHELRRKLRWLSIYATSLDGAVQLDTAARAPKGWARYLTPAVVNNPFNALPKGDGRAEPLRLPAPLFYALSWLIAELGALKDRAQWTEVVAHGLDAVGLGDAKPKRLLGDATLEAREAGKLAGAIAQKTLFEDKLLPRLADAIEAQV
jgi:hypothetical protein